MAAKFNAKAIIKLSIFFMLSFAQQAFSADATCDGPYQGKVLSQSEVESLVKNRIFKQTINLCGSLLEKLDLSHFDLSRINFNGANLSGADLSYTNLEESTFINALAINTDFTYTYARWADFSNSTLNNSKFESAILTESVMTGTTAKHVDFINAKLDNLSLNHSILNLSDFTNSNLSHSDLSNSDLKSSILSNADLSYADFSNAVLTDAILKDTLLYHCKLSGAALNYADLQFADFEQTNITNTDFTGANFKYTNYQPSLVGLPLIHSVAAAKNFETIKFYDNQLKGLSLTALRNAYKNAGMRPMERKITAMVKTSEMNHNLQAGGANRITAYISYIAFYLTCAFGLSPIRPILILLAIMLAFSIFYRIALSRSSTNFGIRIINNTYNTNNIMTSYHYNAGNIITNELKNWAFALFYSFLSAFSIGWDDFNISKWLLQLQKSDFSYKSLGWVRTIAGAQSLISAYLLILWALTYFGRPFEW